MRICLTLGVIILTACKPAHPAATGAPDGGALPDTSDVRDAADPDAPADAAPDAPPDAPAPDTTPPSVVQITPPPGSPVWLQTPVRLTFDEDLAASSTGTVAVTLAGAPVDATVTFEAPRTLVVTLAPAARGVGALALHVMPAVEDLSGNASTGPVDVMLQVTPWSAVPLDRGTATSAPALTVDGHGTVTAAWLVSTGGAHRVVVSQLAGSTWTDLGDTLGITDATSVAVALDEAGTPLVAVADSGVAHVARWTGSMWSELPSPGTGDRVALVTPAGGHPICAVASTDTVQVSELVANDWQTLGADLALPATPASELALAAPAPSVPVVGWIDTAGTLRVYRLDASWSALAPIAVSAGSRLSLAARGTSIAVAYDAWAGSFGVLAAIASGGSTAWTQLGKPLDIDIAGDARSPAIALDGAGTPYVAWTELVETARRGALARWTGSAWTLVGGITWLASSVAVPLETHLVLGPAGTPIAATAAGGAITIARFNGPRTVALGLTARAPLTGCSFDPLNPPAALSQTGCFDLSTAGKPVPHAGLVPYDINAELWSDGAKKRRWIALPEGASMTLGSNGAWAAPTGTFIVKEFALEFTPGAPATRRVVETRFLVNDPTNGWMGFSYRWNTQGTDAALLPNQAYNIAWTLDDGTQHIHVYPSRDHCRSCHYYANGPLLGLRPEQLARWFDYGGQLADQLPTLAALGIGPLTTPPPFTAPHDPSASWEKRTRGYMAANCAHCHNPNYISIKDLRYATPLASTRLCEVIVPGDPSGSIVYQKVTSRPGMPPLGTDATDPLIAQTLGNWITGMTSCP